MSSAVVRCPACLGACRVGAESLGQMVACPRCQVPFVAAEEVAPTVQPAARPRVAVPVAPSPRRPRRERPPAPGPVPERPEVPPVPDPEHDPHLPPVAGLPVSVLVGLSLLPFAIPVLWWAAPFLTGQEPALSLAVPCSLAVAASALCLGVVYTIDWAAATRIKGVLMLVALAYLTAAGLFFLKKNLMDRARHLLGPGPGWVWVHSGEGQFHVRMPGRAEDASGERPLPEVRTTAGRKASLLDDAGDHYRYLVTASPPDQSLPKPADEWLDSVGAHLARGGRVLRSDPLTLGRAHGRQWTVEVKEGVQRVVRVYVSGGRVYYLSVEGRHASPDDPDVARPFFESFDVTTPARR